MIRRLNHLLSLAGILLMLIRLVDVACATLNFRFLDPPHLPQAQSRLLPLQLPSAAAVAGDVWRRRCAAPLRHIRVRRWPPERCRSSRTASCRLNRCSRHVKQRTGQVHRCAQVGCRGRSNTWTTVTKLKNFEVVLSEELFYRSFSFMTRSLKKDCNFYKIHNFTVKKDIKMQQWNVKFTNFLQNCVDVTRSWTCEI